MGIALCIAAAAACYASGLRRLWRRAGRGRVVARWRAAAYAAGLATLVLALLSPLDRLADALFSVHMVQHLLLILVAAPLIVLGAPLLPVLWALPPGVRRKLARRWRRSRALRATAAALTAPAVVWGAHVAALWLWHLPALYDSALAHEGVHALEHASFLVTAVLFWWVIIQPTGRRRLGYGAGILFVGAAMMQMGVLGALITFTSHPWYAAQAASTLAHGRSPLADQQLAGVIMWIPASVVYLAATLFLGVRWLGSADAAEERELLRTAQSGNQRAGSFV